MVEFKILELVKSIFPEIIQVRRHLHAHPELSFQEFETSIYIKNFLDDLNIKNKIVGGTGVVATIGKGKKSIAFRADIDALPIEEETRLEYSSLNHGLMHACGHDLHTSILLGTALLLKNHEEKLNITVKLIFQPGEERTPGGAITMIESGVLENPHPDYVFGMHVDPEKPAGTISLSKGYVMASTDELFWTVSGKGGHAAQPHTCQDTILSSANIITNMQFLLTKYKNPVSPGILSIASINGGTATNVFPDEVKMKGTFRSYSEQWRKEMHQLIINNSKLVCEQFGTKCDVNINAGHPALFNNDIAVEKVRKVASSLVPEINIQEFEPKLWGEDFAYYAERVPSAFWFLGAAPVSEKHIPMLHNARFAPNEEAMIYGIALEVAIALGM